MHSLISGVCVSRGMVWGAEVASRELSESEASPIPHPPGDCLPPSDGRTACAAEFQTWCDGRCIHAADAEEASCETLCGANPDNGNTIECTPALDAGQLPCFSAESPEEYPGASFKVVDHTPTVFHEAPECCSYDTEVRYFYGPCFAGCSPC